LEKNFVKIDLTTKLVKLESGPMPNVMAVLRNIGGANEERKFRNSLNTFLVPRHKLWLMPTVRVPCSNAVNIGEHKLGRKVNFIPGKIPLVV